MFGGHESKFYYVLEEPYGVTPENPAMKGIEDVILVEPSVNAGNIKRRGIGTRDLTGIKRGLLYAGLKVEYNVPSDDVMQFLQHAVTVYPHTCEVYYEKVDALVDMRFVGCKFDSATVECHMDELLRASAELVAQNLTVADTKISGATYTDFAGALGFSQCYVSLGAADGTNQVVSEEVTDWKFTIKNNLKRVGVIRSTDGYLLKYLQPRHRELVGELVFEFENKTRFYELLTDAEFSIKFGLGPKYALFKYCKWDSTAAPTRIEDLVSVPASFSAKTVEFEGVVP